MPGRNHELKLSERERQQRYNAQGKMAQCKLATSTYMLHRKCNSHVSKLQTDHDENNATITTKIKTTTVPDHKIKYPSVTRTKRCA